MQQNVDGSDFFTRTWEEYKAGFGDESQNYWIGNECLHALTYDGGYKLRAYLQSLAIGDWYYEEFSTLIVDDEANKYQLTSVGSFSGNAGQGYLPDILDSPFSTYDQDTFGCVNNEQRSNGGGGWFISTCESGFFLNTYNGVQEFLNYRFSWINLPDDLYELKTSRLVLIKK